MHIALLSVPRSLVANNKRAERGPVYKLFSMSLSPSVFGAWHLLQG